MKRRKGRGFSWFFVLIFGVAIYFSTILFSQHSYISRAEDEQAEAEARLAAAQQENEKLRQEREDLQRLDYVEKIAREELGMTKKGELPYSTSRVQTR